MDTKFFTNEDSEKLSERLGVIIGQDTKQFDSLTGYFYITGYKLLSKALLHTQKVRILIGMDTNSETIEAIVEAQQNTELPLNRKQAKQKYTDNIKAEFEKLDDTAESYNGTKSFIEGIISGHIEVKIYPKNDLHAKLYVCHYENSLYARDKGRVITGSSNFSVSGLTHNLELNVELKDVGDYDYAKKYFNALWEKSLPVNTHILDTVKQDTWFNDSITPYELYLKFLYEHFKEDLNSDVNFKNLDHVPDNFMELEYQKQAVITAKRMLEQYNGVFISDVVGLGKTFMGALLAKQLGWSKRILVVAPPALIDKNNKGGWYQVFDDFHIKATFLSIGSLDNFKQDDNKRYDYIFIDEAHRFRNQKSSRWDILHNLCKGSKVVLLSATPYNNHPKDILAQITLFQSPKNSDIPNYQNLEKFFKKQERIITSVPRTENAKKYIQNCKKVANAVREEILKHVMIRRTRTEIKKYFEQDLLAQNLSFPTVHPPEQKFYQLNDEENRIFDTTLHTLKKMTYARYTPKLYLKSNNKWDILMSNNILSMLKTLTLKRMDSSISAFLNLLENMLNSSNMFYNKLSDGYVYYYGGSYKKLESALIYEDNEFINTLLESGELEIDDAEKYTDTLKDHIKNDIDSLKQIIKDWEYIASVRDVKKDEFLSLIKKDNRLKDRVIIFTESKITAEYLAGEVKQIGRRPLVGLGSSGVKNRRDIIDNFTPDKNGNPKSNAYDILIVTDAYAEGINLHSTNVIINYDIPWNPTRMMQRAGRVNRVGTKFKDIYSFNFFPSKEVDDVLELESLARAKIEAFFNLLGEDAGVLGGNENPEPKGLFDTNMEENDFMENSELKYFKIICDIRDNSPELYKKIQNLPIKSRSWRHDTGGNGGVLSYIRKGAIKKHFLTTCDETTELDFTQMAKKLESAPNTPIYKMTDGDIQQFYKQYNLNICKFNDIINPPIIKASNSRTENHIQTELKYYMQSDTVVDADKQAIQDFLTIMRQGDISATGASEIKKQILGKDLPIGQVLDILKLHIPHNKKQMDTQDKNTAPTKRQVVVSMYIHDK